MADTARTLAELQALLADNTTEAISPQDLRDFLVSCFGGHGGLYVTATGAITTNIAAAKLAAFAGTFPATGTTPSASDDSITVAVAGRYEVHVNIAFLGTAAETFTFQVYQTAVAVTGMTAVRTQASATDVEDVSIDGIVECVANDVLTVYASSGSNGSTVTLKSGQFTVRRVT